MLLRLAHNQDRSRLDTTHDLSVQHYIVPEHIRVKAFASSAPTTRSPRWRFASLIAVNQTSLRPFRLACFCCARHCLSHAVPLDHDVRCVPPSSSPSLLQYMNEDASEQYDRQIRLWGVDAQKRMSGSKVLFSGINGVSNCTPTSAVRMF